MREGRALAARERTAWTLPLRVDRRGEFGGGRGDLLEDTVRLVIEVRPGERPLLPGFGCRIHFLPAIATEAERHAAAALVEEALERWTPWLGVERVDVLDADESSVRLVVRRDGEVRELEIAWRPRGADGGSDEEDEDA